MSPQSSSPPGAVDVSRIANPPTCPLWRAVSRARNCVSRLVSCRILRRIVADPAQEGRGLADLQLERGDAAAALAVGGRHVEGVGALLDRLLELELDGAGLGQLGQLA